MDSPMKDSLNHPVDTKTTITEDPTRFARTNRGRVIAGRWLSLLATGWAAALIWAIAAPLLVPFLVPVHRPLASLPLDYLVPVLLISCLLISWPWARGRRDGWLGLRYVLAYPPLWVGVLFTVGWLVIWDGITSDWASTEATYDLLVWTALSLGIGTCVVVVGAVATFALVTNVVDQSHKIQPRNGGRSSAAVDQEPSPLFKRLPSHSAITGWLKDDRAIKTPDLDMFGHNEVAQRIVRRLESDPEEEAPTMAVIGPIGSGKSSIQQLVAYHLHKSRRLRIVNISLWPYDSSESAVRGILQALVGELSRCVNTLGLASLTAQYVSVVETIGGHWGGLAGVLRQTFDPADTLSRLSNICCAIDIKIVLWIEDLERFSSTDHLKGDLAALRDAERLGPVRALLYLLDDCPGISVIVSDTSLESRFDLSKIARFVEKPPTISATNAWCVIGRLRQAWLANENIDPADPGRRDILQPPDDSSSMAIRLWRINDQEPKAPEALGLLLNTPRILKSSLRLTNEAWIVLAGEIDVDDLLIMNAIRESRPQLFSFIDEHIEQFRSGFSGNAPILQANNPIEHPVFKQFQKILEGEPSELLRNAITVLIRFVFPGLPRERIHNDADRAYIQAPQGLAVVRHVDYWRRYLSVSPVDEKECDQSALHAIEAWKNGNENDLIDRLLDPKRSDQIETFVRLFSSEPLCRLLTGILERARMQDARDWPDRQDGPGIVSLWRMMQGRPPDSQMLFDTLQSQLAELVSTHLPLVHNLLYWYGGGEGSSVRSLIDDSQHTQLHQCFRNQLSACYSLGAGVQLLSALKKGSPYTLSWICWGLDRIRAGHRDGLPFEKWPAFSMVMLEAASLEPATGLAQIIPFVIRTDHRNDSARQAARRVAEFDHDAAHRLFDYDQLIALLADADVPDGLDDQLQLSFEVAVNAAKAVEGQHSTDPNSANTSES